MSTNKHNKGNNRAVSLKHQTNTKKNDIYGYEQPIPNCQSCGTPLRFELQLLSSLLHVLNVDNFAIEDTSTTRTGGGGMDWGNICVYTCPNHASVKCHSKDAFCIVQDSIDHQHLLNHPSSRHTATTTIMHQLPQSSTTPSAVVVIPEDTQFDPDDDDDGIVLVGDEYDNVCDDDDDDDSVW